MVNDNYYKHGSWNVICQRCGFKHKAEEVKKEWTGLTVCGMSALSIAILLISFVAGRRSKECRSWLLNLLTLSLL
jgi:hypothetical protein